VKGNGMEPELALLFNGPDCGANQSRWYPGKAGFSFFAWQKACDYRECSRKIACLGGKEASKTADLTDGTGR
jgi:hypothetical protein